MDNASTQWRRHCKMLTEQSHHSSLIKRSYGWLVGFTVHWMISRWLVHETSPLTFAATKDNHEFNRKQQTWMSTEYVSVFGCEYVLKLRAVRWTHIYIVGSRSARIAILSCVPKKCTFERNSLTHVHRLQSLQRAKFSFDIKNRFYVKF